MTNETTVSENRKKAPQSYYDALVAAGYFDYKNIEKMRDFAVIKNGKVTYPIYDLMLNGQSPVYDENDMIIPPAGAPSEETVRKRLEDLAKEGELYFYHGTTNKDIVPKKVEFSVDPKTEEVTASLSKHSMIDKPEKFPDPGEKPAELGGWRGILNSITFGLAFSGAKKECDDKIRQWEKDSANYQKMMADRNFFVRHQKTHDLENQMRRERAEAKKGLASNKQYQARLKAVYGANPQKIGSTIDREVNDFWDIQYDLPKGITDEMAAALGPLAMYDPEIIDLALYDEVSVTERNKLDQQKDEQGNPLTPEQKKEMLANMLKEKNSNPVMRKGAVDMHSLEDVVYDRKGIDKSVGACIKPARNNVKEALDDFRLNNNAEKLGEIIARGTINFVNDISFSDVGLTEKMSVVMKNNAAIAELLENKTVLNAAKAHGLQDKTLETLRAHKNITEIRERNMAMRERFLTEIPKDREKTENDLADYLLDKMVNNTIVRQTNERSNLIMKIQENAMQAAIKEGKMKEAAELGNAAALKYQNEYETSSAFDDFGKKDVETMRKEIKDNLQFKMMLKNIMEEQSLSPLCNEGKLNSLTNNLCTAVVHSEKTNSAMKSAERAKAMEEYNRNKNYEKSTTVGPNI